MPLSAESTMAPRLEVCVDNLESVQATVNGGGHRIELCSSLLDGGLTPSAGFLKQCKRMYPHLTVFAMIRPRGGDFCYTEGELQVMLSDIEILTQCGADGFVFGCLLPDGSVDLEANNLLLKKASPLPCTFHRAFDMVSDLQASLENIIQLGFARILTSGGAKSAFEGLDDICKLVHLAQDRIIIMPGSGVNADNLEAILNKSKAQEYHSSASALRHSMMVYKNPKINMGSNSSEFAWKACIAEKVKELIDISNKY